jgi:hypothetical protein
MKSVALACFFLAATGNAALNLPDPPKDECRDTAAKVEERERGIGFFLMPGSYCTGTLISPHVVLTAGHCVVNQRPENIKFSIAKDMASRGEIKYARASRVAVHPEYQSPEGQTKVHADIALVQLQSTDYGGPALQSYYSFGGTNLVANGVPAVVIGFGTDKHGMKGIKRSKRIKFESVLPSTRDKALKTMPSLIKIAEGDTGEHPCKGDSGAAVLKYVDGRTRIVGIYSEARARVNRDALASTKPGVRSRDSYVCRATEASFAISIDPFAKWIDQTRRALETDPSYVPCP